MSAIDDAHAIAALLRDSAAEALDTVHAFDATLDGAPDRLIVSPGPSVDDCCPQLAVYIMAFAAADTTPGGLASGKRHQFGMVNHVTFQIRSTRCIPTGFDPSTGQYSPPPVAALNAASRQLNCDGWALWNHLYHLQASDLLLNLCDEVFFDGINAIQPSGGCGGWVAQIRAYVDGYEEVLST